MSTTNGNLLKNKANLKKIQKAIMAGIGIAASREAIKKAVVGIYDDIQGIVQHLLKDLEEQGELKTKETKNIIKALHKRSDLEKEKIYRKLQKESKYLFNTAKDAVLTPFAYVHQLSELIKGKNENKKVKTIKSTRIIRTKRNRRVRSKKV